MRNRFSFGILVLCVWASCVSYEVSRIETDTAIDRNAYESFKVGETLLAEAVKTLGPPDRLECRWDGAGERFVQFEYSYGKQRASDLEFNFPIEEISRYNAGVRFFLIFLNVLRGGSVVPREVREFQLLSTQSPREGENGTRLSHIKRSNKSRALRMSSLRRQEYKVTAGMDEPLTPFRALDL